MKIKKLSKRIYRRIEDAVMDIQRGTYDHETHRCAHCNKPIFNPEGFENVKRGWAVYKSVHPDYYHDECWDETLIEAHKKEEGKRKDFLLYFGRDINIKINDVKEFVEEAEDWEIELIKRLKTKLQEHIGEIVKADFLESLLDKEGVRNYVRCTDVESGKERAREGNNPKSIYIMTNDAGQYGYIISRTVPSTDSILYLRKVKKQNEFRIGILEAHMESAGMGGYPKLDRLQDLLILLYEQV